MILIFRCSELESMANIEVKLSYRMDPSLEIENESIK